MTETATLRRYVAHARSTDTFGRVLCSARDQHFVVDGPVQNGCPGEAVTPGELFLSSVAACGVELVQVFARQEDVPLRSIAVEISGELDLDDPVRPDVTVFRRVGLAFALGGPSEQQAELLVKRFKGR
jgi:uncharacterized OsmC-like protein